MHHSMKSQHKHVWYGIPQICKCFTAVGSPCESSPCEQVCNENANSYECSCLHGYMLQSNGMNCVGKYDTAKMVKY